MKIGPAELLVIILFAFVIIGPERLPKAGKAIGRALGSLRKTSTSINDTLKEEGLDPESLKEASGNPFLALEKIEKVANAIPQEEDGEDSDDDAASAGEGKPSGVTPLSDRDAFGNRKAQVAKGASAEVADGASELTDDHA